MFKVSNFCVSLYFYLAAFCPSKGDIFQCRNGCLVPSEEMYDFINPCKDGMNAEQCYYHDKWDFENELYKTINNRKSPTNWVRSNGITITGSPHSDHSGNNTAHFITLPSRRVASPAVLRIGVIFAASNQLTCQLSFYYWIGQINGTVTVGLWSPSERTINTIWQERSGIKNQWQRTVLIINNTLNTEVLQLSIEGQIFEPWVSGETIAIDDISVTEGCLLAFDKTSLCKQKCHAGNETCILDGKLLINASNMPSNATHGGFCFQQSCNFKIQVCDWIADELASHVSWVPVKQLLDNGLKSILLKDGSNDSNGHYKWVQSEDSAPNESTHLNGSMCHCLRENCHFWFYYSQEGSCVLKAVLYTKKEEKIMLWSANGSTNHAWVKVKIQIPAGLNKNRLFLEGTIEDKASNICLDHSHPVYNTMSELPRSCSSEEFSCANGQCLDIGLACDFQMDCVDGSDEDPEACANYTLCNFESDLCKWKTLNPKEVQWNIMKRQASHNSGLPLKDHTTNSDKGNFIYVTGLPWTKTKLVVTHFSSPIFTKLSNNATDCQIRFWYQLSQDSQLNIFIRTSDGYLQSLNSQPFKSKMQWTKADVCIRNTTREGPFQIILQAIVQTEKAFVAVDDISITKTCKINVSFSSIYKEGETKLETPHSLSLDCPLGLLPCKDGECVSSDKFCDFTLDCSDGSDETMCSAKCDFESDSCGWLEMSSGDGFDWVRSSRTSLPPAFHKQAPPNDHTYNKSEGHFMFILKNSSSISQIAQLRSPKFSQSGSDCSVTFWYYNYGLSVGAAEMQLLVDGLKDPTVLWRIYYNQGDQWLKASIQLGRLPQPFQLSLNKVSLGFYDGVSAIDDITFESCALPPPALNCEGPDHFWCQDSKACISRLLLCDLVDDCGDGSDEKQCEPELQCNFELGLCNWEQDMDDDFNWTRTQGPTSTPNTGPMKDHTLGTVKGYYLYIESSEPQMFQNRAALLSPIFHSTFAYGNKSCLFRFHYHMFGKHIYRLAVSQRSVSNTRGHLLWHTFGNQGNRWKRKVLYITSSEPFQILVEGTVGDGFTGDIGIDDLSFMDCMLYNGSLPVDAITPSMTSIPVTLPMNNCTEKEFVCRATGQCVNVNQRCDFQPDCPDKSDESSCAPDACDFDHGNLCEWYQPAALTVGTYYSVHTTNVFQWGLGKGSGIHPGEENHRPLADHTTATKEGFYLFADSSNGKYGHTADIITPVISQTGPKCRLVFWNYMYGATVGTLKVLSKVGNVTSELWAQSGPQGRQWNRAEVFFGVRSYFQVVFRTKRGISYMGDVAVDDILFKDCSPLLITNKHCTSEEFTCANKYCLPKDNLCDFVNDCADNSDENDSICSVSIGRCDFEFDLCDWEQDQNDDFDWNLRSGGIPRLITGPVADHTLHKPSGHYISIKNSFPQLPGQEARISSGLISKKSKNCKIIFYYHMYGANIGSLTVSQVTVSNQTRKTLFSLSENQGNFWKRVVLPLGADEDFWVIFEGRAGKDYRRSIALDDIVFTRECLSSSKFLPDEPTQLPTTGSCLHGYLECLNGKCYRPEQSCNFEDDCGDNTDERECGTSCTFENGMCGWKNSLADNFDWVMRTSSPQSLRPSKDHTLGNGKGQFLYLEATSTGVRGDKAHLKSARWIESSAACTLSFWYYMSSKATGRIQVLIKIGNGFLKVWSDSGVHSGQWKKAQIQLGKLRNFAVLFEGIRTKDLGGGAAIDDIEYENCSTTGEDSGVCPAVTDFVCKNKQCIESHLVCDYKPDCKDWSDEADCSQYTTVPGSCNFETQGQEWSSVCGLRQDFEDDFDWNIGNKVVIEQGDLIQDHTPGNGANFLYINSTTQHEGNRARIITTTYFPASLGVCRLRFWFWMYNSPQTGTLKVYVVEKFGMDILMWAATGNKRNVWTYANVALSSNTPFKVAFEAETGAHLLLEFALDDISLTPECVSGGPITSQPPTCSSDQFTCTYVKQCVPLSSKCNLVEDCGDGSDEMACPTKNPNTGSPSLCKETEFMCANQSCIPSLLRCDGVTDCRFSEDEVNCPIKDCFNGSLLCPSTNSCIPVSQRCDGIVDCIDFAPDESSCSDCPEGYCKNGGTCNIELVPVCQCGKEWKGNRCNVKAETPGPLQNDTWTGLSIGLALLLIEIAATVSCLLSKRKLARTKPEENFNTAFDNPLYEAQSVKSTECSASLGARISVSPWQAQQEVFCNNDVMPTSFANPLYGITEEKGKTL